MTINPLAIAEILELILRFLDQRALLNAVLVSKSWNTIGTPILWRHPSCYQLSDAFLKAANIHAHNTVSLNLYIDLWSPSQKTKDCTAFGKLLQQTTRLRRLRLRPAHHADPFPGCVSNAIQEAIVQHVGPQLEELRVNFTFLCTNTAGDFFRACKQLKALDISASRELADEICASTLELEELQLCPSAEDQDPLIGNDGLAALGRWLTHGKTLVMRHFLFTEIGIRSFLTGCCKGLTRIGFAGCEEIPSHELQQIVEALPLLEQVDFSSTNACDSTILKLAQVARAPRLKELIVSDCRKITSLSIRQIVTCCENLEVLDCESCPYVRLDIFEPPAWVSDRLQRLMIGGIHQDRARVGQERPPAITDEHLTNMYDQIAQLRRLRVLSLRDRTFTPKLFELGRAALEGLPYLRSIDIATDCLAFDDPPLRRDFIWLATCLPQLAYLTTKQNDLDSELLEDLVAINSNLRIHREAPEEHSVTDYPSAGEDHGFLSDDSFATYHYHAHLHDSDDDDDHDSEDDDGDDSNTDDMPIGPYIFRSSDESSDSDAPSNRQTGDEGLSLHETTDDDESERHYSSEDKSEAHYSSDEPEAHYSSDEDPNPSSADDEGGDISDNSNDTPMYSSEEEDVPVSPYDSPDDYMSDPQDDYNDGASDGGGDYDDYSD
ncbi:hypothetical protein BGZ73_007315 [Actinomortierella ambigua]|nr:hypothetical protein BGZ73_007315 [Actinomortierella ambigua]